MILRRLVANLRQQHWTAIAIEFVLLVVGVFLGIQLGNWNQDRVDRQLGRAYAERLVADMTKDRKSRQRLIDYYQAVTASAEWTSEHLDDPAADPSRLVLEAYRASEYLYAPKTRSTWDEIVSSGHIGLLPRGAGRSVTEYYAYDAAADAFANLEASVYRHRVRSLLPHRLQDVIRAHCSDKRNEAGHAVGFRSDCTLEFDDAIVSSGARALHDDPTVTEGLRYQFSTLSTANALIAGEMTQLDRALTALGTPPSATSEADSAKRIP